jgi:hypothetical protein
MSSELDLFGEPLPPTAPKPPAYDKLGPKPVQQPRCGAEIPIPDPAPVYRRYEIVKEDKTKTWIFYQ